MVRRSIVALACLAFLAGIVQAQPIVVSPPNAAAYDPLALPADPVAPKSVDLTIEDSARSRQIPIRVWLPTKKEPAPVVLFSHGLGGSRENNSYLAKHWASRG
jgi:predicted dienelactone hydrolase